jgi:hypothetical protein
MALEYLNNIGRTKDALKLEPSSPFQQVLKDWAETRIAVAIEALISGYPPHEATGSLAQSIAFQFNNDTELSLEFLMNYYWDFVNSGVNGVERSYGAPYSFKTINPSPTMVDAIQGVGGLDGWIRAKNIKSLTYTNQFNETITEELVTDDDFRGAAYVFARAIKKKGIEGNHFIDIAFSEEAMVELEEQILDEFEKLL